MMRIAARRDRTDTAAIGRRPGSGPVAEHLDLVELVMLSDVGRVRHHNEDRALGRTPVIAVADGDGRCEGRRGRRPDGRRRGGRAAR